MTVISGIQMQFLCNHLNTGFNVGMFFQIIQESFRKLRMFLFIFIHNSNLFLINQNFKLFTLKHIIKTQNGFIFCIIEQMNNESEAHFY